MGAIARAGDIGRFHLQRVIVCRKKRDHYFPFFPLISDSAGTAESFFAGGIECR
jgi:hypothetical protein